MSREEEIVDEEPLINEEMADPNDKSIAEANACNEKFSLNRSVMVGPDEPLPKRVINFSQTIQTQIRPIFDIRTFSSDSKSVHFFTGLRDYNQFLMVFRTLEPYSKGLKYFFI